MSTEREVKLSAWPGFEMPELVGLVPGLSVRDAEPLELDAVYYDTPDLRLIRRGITLRHRTGDEPPWTLKLPEGPSGRAQLRRREIALAGDESAAEAGEPEEPGSGGEPDAAAGEGVGPPGPVPPAELAALVTAMVRTAPLEPVARLHTRRRPRTLVARGRTVGEIDDDEVSVLDGSHVAARFREIEVELAPDVGDELVTGLVDRLRAAGAGAPDPTPKLVRALGPRALAAPELEPPAVGPGSTVAQVVQAGITGAVALVIDHDPVIRLDDDIEGVHQARVGTRRLRSDLRTYGPVLDRAWADGLREELGWLASELGVVRDLDVLLERLWRDVNELPDPVDRGEGALLMERLERERGRALARLLRQLGTRRYVRLLDRLVVAAAEPHTTAAARRPAGDVLPGLVARPFGRLVKEVGALGPEPTDEQLHRIRIHAKRARYAADVAVPVVGKPARRLAKALGELQDVLGDHHDAAVAVDRIRALAAPAPKAQVLVAGQLIARQQQASAVDRVAWWKAWDAVVRPKCTEWLS